MKLAVIASPGESRNAFAAVLKSCLPEARTLSRDLDGLCGEGLPEDTAAALVLVDNMHDLLALRRVAGVYPALPVAVVSHSPDFSLEAIRQGARDYLIQPVIVEELGRAVRRMGLCGERGKQQLAHFDTG